MPTRLPERNLDVLRAIAVLCVLGDHVLRIWYRAIGPVTVDQIGTFGVFIFFVHTSLVLMPSLERLRLNGFTGAHWIRAFYMRRAFRIYPVAWVTIAIALRLRIPPFFFDRWGIINPFTVPATKQLIGNILLSQNLLGVTSILSTMWSLAVEVQMYLVLPFAFLLARRSLRGFIGVGVVGVALSAFEWHIRYGTMDVPLMWRLTVLQYVPCFMCGVLAYALIYRREHRNGAARPVNPLAGGTMFLAIVAALVVFVVAERHVGTYAWSWPACLVLGLAIPYTREFAGGVLTRVAHEIATYSYGIYLLHPVALWVGFVMLRQYGVAVQCATFVVLVVALPVFAYHFVEKPCIQWGQRLLHGPLTRAATAGAP
jgi:peptidoglycan/LPS O-acetylase OafA/YrhL